jgi:precorrin-6B methylase 2
MRPAPFGSSSAACASLGWTSPVCFEKDQTIKKFQKTLLTGLEGEAFELSDFDSVELADLYTASALLVTMADFLKEELWLQKEKKLSEEFLAPYFSEELKSVEFLKGYLLTDESSHLKKISRKALEIENLALEEILTRSSNDKKEFGVVSLKTMLQLFLHEEDGHRGLRLYRTFDGLDCLFGFDYKTDGDQELQENSDERLYIGGGVGVQSGFSTILMALNLLSPKEGAKIVDLGSGYGRVGLVFSLLRLNIDFIGYEIVGERNEQANQAAKALGLSDRLQFITQDLSLAEFQIPEADIYYMYDPFTEETYQYILKQIKALSEKRSVTIVTKGNASQWLSKFSQDNDWEEPILLDKGNLCLFRSC